MLGVASSRLHRRHLRRPNEVMSAAGVSRGCWCPAAAGNSVDFKSGRRSPPQTLREAIPYKLHQVEPFQYCLGAVTMCVKNAMQRSCVDQIDFKDESTLTADFQHILNMDQYSMSRLKGWISSELDTTIKRGDGSYIKCIQDLAKYAKEAAALPPFNPKLSSTFKPMCRRKPSYKKCLNQVIKIATLHSRKQAKVTPTADFEDCLDMSKDDVFVFIYHLSEVIEVDLSDAIYTLRLRCCQDVADVVCDPNSFLLPYEDEEDEEKQAEDDPFYVD
ncbi:hypothetical protein OROMI_024626 [Orobanche minor]